jgi:hypothetical protein
LGWKLGAVSVLALLLILSSLTFGAMLAQLGIVLAFSGVLCVMVWAVGKGLAVGAPRFLAARKRLVDALVFMAAGVAVASAGAVGATLQPASLLGVGLEVAGTVLLVAGIGAMIVVLVLSR